MTTMQTTTTINLAGQTTVAELSAILGELPPSARVSFRYVAGDQRDPSYITMTVLHPRRQP